MQVNTQALSRGLVAGGPNAVLKSLACRVAPAALPKCAVRRGRTAVRADRAEKEQALQSQILFRPFEEVKDELAIVEDTPAGGTQSSESLVRVGYHSEQELAVNEQINVEYNISYIYHSMSAYFDRDNVALPGFSKYFRNSSEEERSHAQMLMDFQAVRGGRVKLAHITAPEAYYGHDEKGDALHAMELALSLEKLNFQKLRDLHGVAEKHGDAQMQDFIEVMLQEQAADVKKAADFVSQLRRVGKGHGVFHFDQVLYDNEGRLTTPSVTGMGTA
jgi:ferritin heavy chain